MGILDVFRRKDEEPEPKAETVSVESLDGWIESQLGEQEKEARKEAGKRLSGLSDHLSRTRKNVERLREAGLEGTGRAQSAATMAKDSVTNRMLSLLNSASVPENIEGASALSNHRSSLDGLVKEMNKMSPKQLYLLSKYFKEESRAVMESLKELDERAKGLDAFLSPDSGLKRAEDARRGAGELRSCITRTAELKGKEEKLKQEISGLEKSRGECRKRKQELRQGREWKEMERLTASVKEIMDAMSETEARVNQAITPAKRAVKKSMHLSGDRSGFPENPFRSDSQRLAGKMKDAALKAEEGKIQLKPKEAEKLSAALEFLEKRLPEMEKKHAALSCELDEKKRQLQRLGLSRKIREAEDEEKKADAKLKGKWEELDSVMKERKRTEERTEKLRRSLERRLSSATNSDVKLRLPPA